MSEMSDIVRNQSQLDKQGSRIQMLINGVIQPCFVPRLHANGLYLESLTPEFACLTATPPQISLHFALPFAAQGSATKYGDEVYGTVLPRSSPLAGREFSGLLATNPPIHRRTVPPSHRPPFSFILLADLGPNAQVDNARLLSTFLAPQFARVEQRH